MVSVEKIREDLKSEERGIVVFSAHTDFQVTDLPQGMFS